MDTQVCIHATLSHMAAKNVGLRIRIDRELRDAFQAACLAENRPASDVLREFMRSFADRSFNGRQQSLFTQGIAAHTQTAPERSEPNEPYISGDMQRRGRSSSRS